MSMLRSVLVSVTHPIPCEVNLACQISQNQSNTALSLAPVNATHDGRLPQDYHRDNLSSKLKEALLDEQMELTLNR